MLEAADAADFAIAVFVDATTFALLAIAAIEPMLEATEATDELLLYFDANELADDAVWLADEASTLAEEDFAALVADEIIELADEASDDAELATPETALTDFGKTVTVAIELVALPAASVAVI